MGSIAGFQALMVPSSGEYEKETPCAAIDREGETTGGVGNNSCGTALSALCRREDGNNEGHPRSRVSWRGIINGVKSGQAGNVVTDPPRAAGEGCKAPAVNQVRIRHGAAHAGIGNEIGACVLRKG